jgi:hypothetical protein
MNPAQPDLPNPLSRRHFLGTSGKAAIGGALAGMILPTVYGQSGSTKKLPLSDVGVVVPVPLPMRSMPLVHTAN